MPFLDVFKKKVNQQDSRKKGVPKPPPSTSKHKGNPMNNLQPFASSLARGRCLNPNAVAMAKKNIPAYNKAKDARKERRQEQRQAARL